MREKPLQQFQILMLVYQRIYQELTGQEYEDEPRDWPQAKNFMAWKDWNSEMIEKKLRENMPQYLRDTFWKEQNFPAYGLWTQWNKYKPNQVKAAPKRTAPTMLLCDRCGGTYAINTNCECLKEHA